MVLLSIIAPCHNQKDKIRALLASLEHQTLDKQRFEVIVSDDHSTDGSSEWLNAYKGPLNLKAVSAEPPGGRACARNAALKAAAGAYVLFLDGDMTAHESCAEKHLAALQKDDNTVYMGRVAPVPAQTDRPLHWYKINRGAHKAGPGKPLPPRYFTTNHASLSAGFFRKTGPFNRDYTDWGGEGQEMGYRLKAAGACFTFLPEARCFHDHPETLDEYLEKISRYAESGLPRLIRNCPEHAARGYMYYFTQKSAAVQGLLGLFFCACFYKPLAAAARSVRSRFLAFPLLDYITYANIYRGLKRASHD
jgi:glycosyltransferase involved in cell wall biosynthesis